ncbi:MAG: hypothetical protein QM606_07125, partial [Leucobacter sp.]
AGGFGAVAAALAAPPLVSLLLRLGRVLAMRRAGGRGVPGGAGALLWVSIALAAGAVVGVWLLADRHAAEHDPPLTPSELEMQERNERLREGFGDLKIGGVDDAELERQREELLRSLEEIREERRGTPQ